MSETPIDPIHIPTIEELRDVVVPRRMPPEPAKPGAIPGAPSDPGRLFRLTHLAEALLRQAVEPRYRALSLEERWEILRISSGSIKSRVLNELVRQGCIRLESKGRIKRLHLYNRAYEFLGIKPPMGEGVGGTAHRILAERVATVLKRQKYAVYIEQEIGPHRKRVDVVAYGKRRIGIEIGLSDPRQELKNLREDLDSAVLDLVVFVSNDPEMIRKVKRLVDTDAELFAQRGRIRFFEIKEELET